jgi:ABC-2 type transport system permease protein
VAGRVLRQLIRDPRFLVLSAIVPVILVLLLEALFDSVPSFMALRIRIAAYALPAAGFFIFFLTYILCTIVLVRERREGTLSRMFAAGYRRWSVVLGYVAGYSTIAVVQTALVLVTTVLTFDIAPGAHLAVVVATILLLSVVSLSLGVFVSTLARTEGQIFPSIPLIIVPAILLSGLIIPLDELHYALRGLAYLIPLTYAENVLVGVMRDGRSLAEVAGSLALLLAYGVALLVVASLTIRERG